MTALTAAWQIGLFYTVWGQHCQCGNALAVCCSQTELTLIQLTTHVFVHVMYPVYCNSAVMPACTWELCWSCESNLSLLNFDSPIQILLSLVLDMGHGLVVCLQQSSLVSQ